MGLLDGDTALVTGAASGIGRGIARALAAEGARLVLSDISTEAGQVLACELGATFVFAVLSDPAAARPLFAEAEARLGTVSILVHSASPRRHENQTVLAVTETQWDEMVTVGLRAAFVLGQAAGAHMKARAIRGRMLFVTSLHAASPRNLPHYSATKAGQTMLVKELARGLGADGIRVNAIAPGSTPTNFASFRYPGGKIDPEQEAEFMERMRQISPMGFLGEAMDQALLILYLVSPAGRWATGNIWRVNGGQSRPW